jgi:hypothetical protein
MNYNKLLSTTGSRFKVQGYKLLITSPNYQLPVTSVPTYQLQVTNYKLPVTSVTNYILFLFLLLFLSAVPAHSQPTEAQLNALLVPAECFFKSLKDKNFTKTWSLLSRKSQDTIVDDVFKEIIKNKSSQQTAEDFTKEQIMADFEAVRPLSTAYWNNFLNYFNPDLVLSQSKWEIGKIKKDKAEISIQYKKSDNPAMLQMIMENGAWKVGLVETFWTRK